MIHSIKIAFVVLLRSTHNFRVVGSTRNLQCKKILLVPITCTKRKINNHHHAITRRRICNSILSGRRQKITLETWTENEMRLGISIFSKRLLTNGFFQIVLPSTTMNQDSFIHSFFSCRRSRGSSRKDFSGGGWG